ncbi:MAG TPA: GIY-YIG nuclease family protein [Ignavibacteria bacterium]
MKYIFIVYILKNIVNERYYIGQTKDLDKRLKSKMDEKISTMGIST